MKKFIQLFLLVSAIAISACSKNYTDDKKNGPSNLEEIQVPSDFDWRTFSNVDFKLNGSFSSLVEIASANGSTVYHKAYLTKDETLNLSIAVPAFEKELLVRYMGKEIRVAVDNNLISIEL